jgi:serine protease AprX
MPLFTSNYPLNGQTILLSTPSRAGANPAYTGRGVVIAFIDSGFYPHPDLGNRILVHVDATTSRISEQPNAFPASDLSWHGQMTSVIAAGDGRTSNGQYRGIASEVQLVLIKVSNRRSQIKEADILRGMRWLIANHDRFNVRIVNVSVGGDFESSDPEHPLYRAVRKLAKAGVVVVAAAGNRGTHFVVPPASAPEAITVGGIDDHNTLDRSQWTLYHHNYGTAYDGTAKPDLLAPAIWIASPILPDSGVAREARWLAPLLHAEDTSSVSRVLRRGYADLAITRSQAQRPNKNLFAQLQARIHAHKLIDANHQHVDGTSVAAPIVSSVVVQMLEANPGLTPQAIRAILTSTAHKLPGVEDERQGAGVLNASAAVEAALNRLS